MRVLSVGTVNVVHLDVFPSARGHRMSVCHFSTSHVCFLFVCLPISPPNLSAYLRLIYMFVCLSFHQKLLLTDISSPPPPSFSSLPPFSLSLSPLSLPLSKSPLYPYIYLSLCLCACLFICVSV